MKTPTLIGSFILGLSFFIEALAVFELVTVADIFGMDAPSDKNRFELIWIWAFGLVAGVGLGMGLGPSTGYSSDETSDWTIVGGVSAAGVIGISLWLVITNSDSLGIGLAFFAAVMALVGLLLAIASYGAEGSY
ncbi:MAG: hypothetical protein ACXAB4_11115 [Candidatus Hodarchaeales archaeon]